MWCILPTFKAVGVQHLEVIYQKYNFWLSLSIFTGKEFCSFGFDSILSNYRFYPWSGHMLSEQEHTSNVLGL
jgi:hypothetical protein